MTSSVNIPRHICKYLESLDLIKKFSSHTLRAYSSDLLQLFQLSGFVEIRGIFFNGSVKYQYYLTNCQESEISRQPAQWLSTLEKSLRKQTITNRSKKRKISCLNQFLTFLSQEYAIEIKLPIDPPRGNERRLPHFLSVDETIALAQYCDRASTTDPIQRQQALLFYLLYGGGLRVSEACAMTHQQVHPGEKKALVMGKGGKERLVVFPDKVIAVLKRFSSSGTYIWGDKALPTRTAYHRIKQLGVAAGLFKPLHPHALRHSYATQLLHSGSDLRVIQQLLGHKSLAATEVYTHLDINDLARTMEQFHPLQTSRKNFVKK